MKKIFIPFLVLSILAVGAIAFAKDYENESDDTVHIGASLNGGFGSGGPDGVRTILPTTTTGTVSVDARLKERAGLEIDRRIDALNKLSNRIDDKKRVDDDTKAEIQATVDA